MGVVLSLLAVVLVAALALVLLWNRRQVKELLSEQKHKLLRLSECHHSQYTTSHALPMLLLPLLTHAGVSPSPTGPGDNPVYVSVSDVGGEVQQPNDIPCDYLQFRPTTLQSQTAEHLFDNPIYSVISEEPRTVGTRAHRQSVIDPYGNYGDATIAKVARATPTSSSSSHASDGNKEQLFDDENYGCIQKTGSDNDD